MIWGAADSEQSRREARYRDLLALGADEADSWEGFCGAELQGFRLTRGQVRLIGDREQKQLFGAVLVPHNASVDPLPDDAEPVRFPTARPSHQPGDAESLNSARDSADESDNQHPLFEHILKKLGLRVLGCPASGTAKIFSTRYKRTEIIRDINKFRYENLLQIAGDVVLDVVREPGQEEGHDERDLYPFKIVRQAIALLSGRRAISDETELGVGIWEGEPEPTGESPIILVGRGFASYWNGDRKLHYIDEPEVKGKVLDFETRSKDWFDHRQIAGFLEQCERGPEFAQQVCQESIELFSRWRWVRQDLSPIVATGLVLSTFVQSVWIYRPQIAVIGPSNSGKSFLWSALRGVFGNLCLSASKPSAAGIRQSVANSSKIVLIDEFEQDRHRAEILEMFRAASRGDYVPRGTPGQKATTHSLKHTAWVAAIEVGLKRAPDRNRFITLELVKPPKAEHGNLRLPPLPELELLGQKLMAVAVHSIGRAKLLAERLKAGRFGMIDDRVIESFSVPAAMLAVIDRLDHERALELLGQLLGIVEAEGQEPITDESNLLIDILAANIILKGEKHSVGQLLEVVMDVTAHGHDQAEQALGSHGIRWMVDKKTGQRVLAVACRLVVDHLLKGTIWYGQSIQDILKRIPGALTGRKARVGGQSVNCVMITEQYLRADILRPDDQLAGAAAGDGPDNF